MKVLCFSNRISYHQHNMIRAIPYYRQKKESTTDPFHHQRDADASRVEIDAQNAQVHNFRS